MSERILFETDGSVARITLNRPENGNLVTNEMGAELAGMLTEAGAECSIIVLRGAGEDFCLGREAPFDLLGGNPSAMDLRHGITDPALELYAAFRRCPAPILGVIHGSALGFGCAVAGLCDITIAADDARFKVPEMDHDLPPTLVMSALADRVLRKAVMYLVYSRAEIDAAAALAIGLISAVVPPEDLDDEVEAMIRTLSDNSLPAIRAVKEYMNSAPDMDRQGASDFASNLLANVLSSR